MKRRNVMLVVAWTSALVFHGGLPSPSSAQETVAPAEAKILGGLPDRVTFTKTFVYRAKPQASGDETQKAAQKFMQDFDTTLARVVVEKTGDIRREYVTYVSGAEAEIWVQGSFKFWIHSAEPGKIQVALPGMYESDTSLAADFEELSWLTPGAYKETTRIGNVECKVYRRNDKTAWIMQTNLLPARFESPQMSVTYTYAPGPEQDLKLPGKFTDRYKQVMDAWTGRAR